MIKFKFLFITVLTTTSIHLIGMEELSANVKPKKKSWLLFRVNQFKEVKEYNSQNMEFFSHPSEFIGKDILKIIPLNEQDYKNVEQAFSHAETETTETKTTYTFKNKKFIATITPLLVRLRTSCPSSPSSSASTSSETFLIEQVYGFCVKIKAGE